MSSKYSTNCQTGFHNWNAAQQQNAADDGFLAVKLDYRHLGVGSGLEGDRVPPTAADFERWAVL
jgi:hypothetical protein